MSSLLATFLLILGAAPLPACTLQKFSPDIPTAHHQPHQKTFSHLLVLGFVKLYYVTNYYNLNLHRYTYDLSSFIILQYITD